MVRVPGEDWHPVDYISGASYAPWWGAFVTSAWAFLADNPVTQTLGLFYAWFIMRPLAVLYLYGPRQLGFWGGTEPADICAIKSDHSALFWAQHMDECLARIERDFYSLVVALWAASVGLFVWKLLSLLWALWVVRPLMDRRCSHTTPCCGCKWKTP
jgi:hypothetical protein